LSVLDKDLLTSGVARELIEQIVGRMAKPL
jgi:hypothetical protein